VAKLVVLCVAGCCHKGDNVKTIISLPPCLGCCCMMSDDHPPHLTYQPCVAFLENLAFCVVFCV